MRSLIVFLSLAASLAAQTAIVEGVVVNHVTGQPLSDVHVRVLTGDVATISVERVYGATSDRLGHFSIKGVTAGLYLVVPERTGFVFTRPPGPIPATVLALRPGQHITDQKVEMTPVSFVSGRVVEDAGDPAPGASLQLHAAPPDTDFVNPFAIALPNYSDDHGAFHIVVSPGNYYVQAMPRYSGPPGPAGPYVPTWYPSADSQSQASAVEVKPSQDVTLEIRLTHGRQSGPGATLQAQSISGLVTGGALTGAANRPTVYLLSRTSLGTMQMFRGAAVDPAGKFVIRGVLPGSYKLFAQYAVGKLQSQTIDVQVTSGDLDNLQLRLTPGEDLGGSLEVVGEPSGQSAGASVNTAPARRFTVKLESAEPGGPGFQETNPAEVNKDGTFRIPAVFPGRYRVRVEPLPDGAFIRTVTLDGTAVDDAGFELSQGGASAHLKITVSRNAPQVSGTVTDRDGAPLRSPLAAVLVWKDAAQLRPEYNPVSASRYVLSGLRPGKYRLLAVDAFDFTNLAGAGDPDEFAKALLSAAGEIEVAEGIRMVKDLKVVAKEDIHVQPKR